jgi:hypothetical protein
MSVHTAPFVENHLFAVYSVRSSNPRIALNPKNSFSKIIEGRDPSRALDCQGSKKPLVPALYLQVIPVRTRIYRTATFHNSPQS